MKIQKLLFPGQKDYNSLLIRYNGPTFYANLQDDIESKKKLVATEKISLFRNKPFAQISVADIKKHYGSPGCHIKDEYPVCKEIFLYHVLMGKLRVNLELHFSWNELFFYNYSFPYLSDSDKDQVIKVIESKYLNGGKFNFQHFNIADDQFNFISISENIVFTVNYIRYASAFFEDLSLFLTKQEAEKEKVKKKTIKSLYEKL